MSKRSLKRIAAPRTWPIKRKTTKWITRPYPGGQNLDHTLQLNLIFKDLLKLNSNR